MNDNVFWQANKLDIPSGNAVRCPWELVRKIAGCAWLGDVGCMWACAWACASGISGCSSTEAGRWGMTWSPFRFVWIECTQPIRRFITSSKWIWHAWPWHPEIPEMLAATSTMECNNNVSVWTWRIYTGVSSWLCESDPNNKGLNSTQFRYDTSRASMSKRIEATR